MIPTPIFQSVTATPLPHPDNLKEIGLTDKELGGVAINDGSQGLSNWVWTVNVEPDGAVKLWKEGEVATTILVQPDIVDIALAFDQNMQPVLAWESDTGGLFLYWFNPVLQNFVTDSFGLGRNPRLAMDDKRTLSLGTSDVIFAYISGGKLCYRMQRDRFLTEYIVATDVTDNRLKLQRIGLVNYRFQFEISV